GEEIVDQRSFRLDRRLGLDRDLLQRLVDGQEQQIALVLGVQEDGAQADPRAHRDLAHRRVVEPFRNKEALGRILDAPQLVELVARAQAVTGSEHHLSHSSTFSPGGRLDSKMNMFNYEHVRKKEKLPDDEKEPAGEGATSSRSNEDRDAVNADREAAQCETRRSRGWRPRATARR